MAEDSIQLPVAPTVGDKIRAVANTIGGVVVKQEVHTLADPDGTLVPSSALAKDGTLTSGAAKVQVTNLPATQPVSLATNTPDVTDRSSRLLGHVTVDPGSYVSDTFAAKIGQGKARIGGKQVITSTLNPNAYFTVSNPAGNTRNVYVVGFDVYSTSTAAIQYATDFTPVNPSVGTFNPNRATSAPSSAVVYAGTTAYTGATIQPIASQINANSPLKISLLVILPPGQLLGIQVTGATVGASISANVFFYEE